MPANEGDVVRMELLPLEERVLTVPDGCQDHWYAHAANWVRDREVLDIGAGMGPGLPHLNRGGPSRLVGMDPLPGGVLVVKGVIEDVPDKSFDVVVACDVIEHVEDDVAFLGHMLRVARERVFFSTPNWNRSRCQNPHHFREYTPEELARLVEWHRYESWVSDDDGIVTGALLSEVEDEPNFGILIESDRLHRLSSWSHGA